MQITGIPEDWAHHHVVFSDPGTEHEAISAGRHEQWQKIVDDRATSSDSWERTCRSKGPQPLTPPTEQSGLRQERARVALGSKDLGTLEAP